MKISIIIPCYNSEKYLDACMQSVLAQTMTDFEAILIDDGSVDATLQIARRIAQRDPRVRVLAQENSGVSAARNLGLAHAQGEWITFVDSDDLIPSDALEIMLAAADDQTDMVVGAHKTFDESGCEAVVVPETRWMDLPQERKRCAAVRRLIEGDCVLNIMCCKLHRRALIEREQIRLKSGLKIAEDALFNLEAVLCGREIVYVNRVAYLYRIHAASATQSQTQGELDRHRPWLLAMRDLLIRCGVMETYYTDYLNSVVLRLYKDGGVPGVLRGFGAKAAPLLVFDSLNVKRMSLSARMHEALVRTGAYPYVYPAIYPFQVLRRKMSAAAFRLRAGKEMPDA